RSEAIARLWSAALPECRVDKGGARSRAIAKRREVDVVPRPGADGAQERTVDPVHDGAVQLAGAAKPLAVFVHRGDEDVLHLQIASRMQERHGVDEALHRAARDVETDVGGR